MGSAAPRAVVLADSDSRWKWAALVARRIAPDHAIDARFLRSGTAPSQRQIDEVGIVPDTTATLDYTDVPTDPAVSAADVVVLGTTGGTMLTMIHTLGRAWRDHPSRPALVTGYVGVIYENMVDGLLLRCGSDLVLANSAHDAARFRDVYTSLGIDPAGVVETALPFLGGTPHDPGAAGRDRPFTVTFAVQPSVPGTKAARLSLVRHLARHARLHPDREVLLKLRNQPGEAVTHTERFPYQELLRSLPDAPPNLRPVYGDMGSVLDRTDLLVTVSSTAAVESVHRSIPTAVLSDFGVREAHGNHFFVHSGLLTSFADLDAGHVPTVRPEWAAEHGIGRADPYRAARERLAHLRDGGPLAPPRPFYTPERSGDYLETLVGRRGFALDGTPLTGSPTAARPPALKRIVRRGAGHLYRFGRNRLAPAVRRWQQG
ncbi:DUF6716 putative glycosyltransferase [Streptomyces lonarensis]|uniref:Uncharacterized protein n=1 Tax=Streptomyces lonarensis TaxID=700599 RepID=A0A7X6D298_9ACTN|nr:DUF6716 putative glycosyltransferase [Streptomyces lonarensis]NJQ06698.1 hypothetical protein [Streptomyces lonarensis]